VQKECNTLFKIGYDVIVIGRKSKNKFLLSELPYKVIRFRNLFGHGPLMYVVFNLQLFFYLFFKKPDILWSNDLDTLLPNFIISRLKKIKLIYDSHEYFTMSVYKPSSRKVWEKLENYIFPKLKNVITVNDSIKKVYEQKYNVPVTVLKNVAYKSVEDALNTKLLFTVNKKILIMQGTGLNENRGAEEAVLMMQFLPDYFQLYFIGRGTILEKLKQMVTDLQLHERVIFIGVMPYDNMMQYTKQSFLGLIFEKINFNEEHMFALPNRFFDYMKAGIPVLTSKAIEIKTIVDKYIVGGFIENFNPEEMAKKVIEINEQPEIYKTWKRNTTSVAAEFCWENEEKKLISFMQNLS
jgi:glycosyltransferase involved in cell wall biosynthesis